MIIIWKFVRNSRLCTHTLCRRKGCDCEANPRLLLPPYTLYIMQFYAAVTVSVVAMVTGCCYRYCSTRDAAKSSKNRSRCVIIYRYFCIWMTSFISIHRCKMCYWRCLHNTRSKVCNRYVTVGCPSVRPSVPSIDSSSSRRRPAVLLVSSGVCSRYRSTAAGAVLQAPVLSRKWR